MSLLQELLQEPGGLDFAEKTVVGSLSIMEERRLTRFIDRLRGLIDIAAEGQKPPYEAELTRLLDERRALRQERAKKTG